MGHKDCSSSTSYHGIHALKPTANDPENKPFQKETIVFSIPTIHFQARLLFVSGRVSLINQFLTPGKWMVEKRSFPFGMALLRVVKSFYCKTSRQLPEKCPPPQPKKRLHRLSMKSHQAFEFVWFWTQKRDPLLFWHGTMARLNGHSQVCEQRNKN